MARVPEELIAKERALLAEALQAALEVKPRKRALRLRKVSDHVQRIAVSAGCFGETVQWRLAGPKKKPWWGRS